MKTTNHKADAVKGGNMAALLDKIKAGKLKWEDVAVLVLIADMMDEDANGGDLWLTVGMTRNKSAFALSVKGSDAPEPIYGADLADLNRLAVDLL